MPSFSDIDITPTVERAFAQDGITAPTPIQTAAIPKVLEGDAVVIESGTGTGKTLAYLLPILQRLADNPAGRTVILAPSTELAVQTLATARRYRKDTVSVAGLVAGGSDSQARPRLQKSTRLIVGTPGRVLELFAKRKLKQVTTMVLDEPDPILDERSGQFLREILSRPEPKVQLIIVGATLGTKARRFLADVRGDNVAWVQVDDSPLQTRIAHHYLSVSAGKDVRLARFIEGEKCRRALVFANQPHHLRHLYRYLREHNLRPATVSRDRSKGECRAAIAAFDQGKVRVLLTTDAAARGLDFPGVDWVLHYDLPTSAVAYLHRAGRTGRGGRTGASVAFVSSKELGQLKRFSRELGVDCPPYARAQP